MITPSINSAGAYLIKTHREEPPLLKEAQNSAPSNAPSTEAGTSRPSGGGSAGGWYGALAIARHALSGLASHVYHAVAARLRAGTKDRTNPARAQSSQELLSMWTQFGNTVGGVAYMVSHRGQTLEGLGTLASAFEGNPQGAIAVVNAAKSTYQSVIVEPLITGGLAGLDASIDFNAALLLSPGDIAGAAADATRVADTAARVAETAGVADRAARVEGGAGNAARVATAPRVVAQDARDIDPNVQKLTLEAEKHYEKIKNIKESQFPRFELGVRPKDGYVVLYGIIRSPPVRLFRNGIRSFDGVPDELLIHPKDFAMDIPEVGDEGIRFSRSLGWASYHARFQTLALDDMPTSTPGGWVVVVQVPKNRVMPLNDVVHIEGLGQTNPPLGFTTIVKGDIEPQEVVGVLRFYPNGDVFSYDRGGTISQLIENPTWRPPTPPPH